LRRPGEDRRLPAQAGLAQALAQVLIEVQQAGLIAQTLAVGRVADHQAGLAPVGARLEGGQLALIDAHPLAESGALDAVARRLEQPRVSLVAGDPQRAVRTGPARRAP